MSAKTLLLNKLDAIRIGSSVEDTDEVMGVSGYVAFTDFKAQADLDMNGYRITNVGLPESATDAATREYVDRFSTFANHLAVPYVIAASEVGSLGPPALADMMGQLHDLEALVQAKEGVFASMRTSIGSLETELQAANDDFVAETQKLVETKQMLTAPGLNIINGISQVHYFTNQFANFQTLLAGEIGRLTALQPEAEGEDIHTIVERVVSEKIRVDRQRFMPPSFMSQYNPYLTLEEVWTDLKVIDNLHDSINQFLGLDTVVDHKLRAHLRALRMIDASTIYTRPRDIYYEMVETADAAGATKTLLLMEHELVRFQLACLDAFMRLNSVGLAITMHSANPAAFVPLDMEIAPLQYVVSNESGLLTRMYDEAEGEILSLVHPQASHEQLLGRIGVLKSVDAGFQSVRLAVS